MAVDWDLDTIALPAEGAAWVDRARRLVPLIEAAGDEIEADRRLPDRVLAALHEARLYRLLLPRGLDGGEVDPLTFAHVIEEIAKADASTAWVLCQGCGCSMVAAYVAPDVAREIFAGPRAILAWGPGSGARAVAVDGGYRVTGTWSFASGGHHATWLGGYAPIHEADGTPRRRADGAPDGRTMLFPATSVTMNDVWHVVGLRGTGSDAFTADDLFVPHAHAVERENPAERRLPNPLYCFPAGSLYASGFAGVALALARRMLDAFVEVARDKVPRGARAILRDNAVVQSQVAQAEARWRAARLFLHSSLDTIWRAVARTGALGMDHRVLIRLAATHAIQESKAVADIAWHCAGATAIFASGPFERRFRDLHAVTQQLQGRQAHFETVGGFVLGLPADTTWL